MPTKSKNEMKLFAFIKEVMDQLDEQLDDDLREVQRRKEKRIKELVEGKPRQSRRTI
jgi:hypothetical protein